MSISDEVRVLFHELADLAPGERERVLAERRIQPEVRAEVESLLSFESTRAKSLTACVAGAAEDMLDGAAGREPGSCGPYRLARLLGSGGMGAVYLAERADGEIEQKVAIKLLRADGHRPGWRDRFLRERQLLASLNHPSIVHVIDAGHTDDGRPYLAMEYVEGVPIDVYAEGIELRDRLKLFLHVCEGVSHAHQHLIIHRDLKPSNILVDGWGQPKVLDFGIAKLLDETQDTTQTVERLLTPNYASPEQLGGGQQSTATDVYSLGAVLYRLLTGRSPHQTDTQESEAMKVMAGTKEILPPSRLNKDVPTDLDYIVEKALRHEPEERYASVDALTSDIRALLESRPVAARSGNAWYRGRRFLRRYWVPVTAAALVVASLAAGLYIANRQRVIAERRFGQLRELSVKVFDLDKAIRGLSGSTQARQRLVTASLEYLEGLRAEAHGDVDLAQELADAYRRVARIQGVPVELNLGQFDEAEATLKKADALVDTVLAARPRSRKALLSSAAIAHDRTIVAQSQHRREEALAHAAKAVERLDAFMRLPDLTVTERDTIADFYGNIAIAYKNLHLYENSVRYARKEAEVSRTLQSGNHRLPDALGTIASAQRAQGDLEAALLTVEEARRIAEGLSYPDETERMFVIYGVLWRQGVILGDDAGISLNRPAEAIEPLRRALETAEEVARTNPNDYASRSRVGSAARDLGNILRHRDPEAALKVYDLGIRRLTEVAKSVVAARDRAGLLANSSYPLRALDRGGAARQRIEDAVAILKGIKQDPFDRAIVEPAGFIVLRALADDEADRGDSRRAVEAYELLLAKMMAAKPDPLNDLADGYELATAYQGLAQLYRRTGDSLKAQRTELLRLEIWQHWDKKSPNNVYVRHQLELASRY